MKTKILVVDDLRENIIALSQLIKNEDVEIYSALTPEEALNLILDYDFGLALLDVQMPTMSGFELARLIRGVERCKHLPMIFVTAHASESRTLFEGYESGAVDVLFKPLDPHIVRNKVQVFVQLDQSSRQLQSQVTAMSRLKEEAELANIAKSRFLANMSHEIRTPLSAVLGFADILSQNDLSLDERQEYVSSISRNGKLLLRIIDDILDLSRIEAQKIEFETSEFDLGELIQDLESTLVNKAEGKGIALEFRKGEKAEGRYVSDPLRLKQVLLNVIGNAIKFTHKGQVAVNVHTRKAPTGLRAKTELHDLIFIIEDTGIGLSDEEAHRLFEPFSQADMSTRRRYGGTGLGLAISKQIARSMGGDVLLCHSKKGEGSTFEVRIRAQPVAGAAARDSASSSARFSSSASLDNVNSNINTNINTNATPKEAPGEALRGKRILVVDDVKDNRTLIERYLKPVGIEVEVASGGQEAVEQAKTKTWDAVLMDIQMPNMDGYEATSQLRKLGFNRPIIALTAHAMREELDRCLKAGCNMTMTKPVAKRDLVEKLQEILVETT